MSNLYYIELGLRNKEGLLTNEEKTLLQQWVESNAQNEAMLQDILKAYDSLDLPINTDSAAAFEEIREKITTKDPEKKKIPRLRRLQYPWAAAAAFLLLVGSLAAFYILQSQSNSAQEYRALAQSRRVTLPDGSQATLAPGSALEYQSARAGRICRLEGTAIFDVTSTGRSFEVEAEGLNIRVLGTIFEVIQDEMTVAVNVTEGQVQVTSGTDQEILGRGDHIELQNGRLSEKTTVSQAIGQWHRQSMNFDNIDLLAGLDSLAQYYPVSFRILNDDLEKCPLRGTLGLGSIDGMIETLKTMLDAKITMGDDGVLEIDGPGCGNQ